MAGERLVIIGGSGAGMSAATNARRGRRDLEIRAFNTGSFVSYAA
jgi:NADPH-dependent 2,4-dienoyl-CoA reductase/sulfur reductase-like enzyme